MTRQERAQQRELQWQRKKLRMLSLTAYIRLMSPYWKEALISGHYCKVSYNERLN